MEQLLDILATCIVIGLTLTVVGSAFWFLGKVMFIILGLFAILLTVLWAFDRLGDILSNPHRR